jgi:glycosyltransferase involved in cell wall biosynthesis
MPLLHSYATNRRIPLVARLTQVGTNEPSVATRGRTGLINRFFLHSYDFTICISTALQNRCSIAGLDRSKFGKISNCVDSERFAPLVSSEQVLELQKLILPNVSRPIVIVPGSVSARKRSHIALAAWKIVKQDYRLDGTLLFVGPLASSGQDFNSQYVTQILESVQTCNLADSVLLTGQKDNIEDYYKISDVLLFVSAREGLPNVLLEGLSCGLPIVCTPLKEITEDVFQDGNEGLYAKDNPESIAERLAFLMKDKELRASMSQRCRERSKSFSVPMIVDEVENVLEKVVTTYPGRRVSH